MIEKTHYYMPSSTGVDTVHVVMWEPEETPKGILQISHGMTEYVDRYDRFATYMANHGFVVIGNDHLGHGETAGDDNFGYFAPKNGSFYMVRDLRRVSCFARKKYPNLPLILMGHSMGSFIARQYAMTYGRELSGMILLGTGCKPVWVLELGEKIITFLSAVRGTDKAKSWIMEQFLFAFYNRRIWLPKTSSDWLTRDDQEIRRYLKDEFCNFKFTLNGYRTLLESIEYVQRKKNIRKIPKKLPILILSGSEDPVGNYGNGVRKVAYNCRKAGVKNVLCHLYPGARHELLNELGYELVQKDILKWVQKR